MKVPSNNFQKSSAQINVLKFISFLSLMLGIVGVLAGFLGKSGTNIGVAFILVVSSIILLVFADLAEDIKDIKNLLKSKKK